MNLRLVPRIAPMKRTHHRLAQALPIRNLVPQQRSNSVVA
jgi:hypothetical protein